METLLDVFKDLRQPLYLLQLGISRHLRNSFGDLESRVAATRRTRTRGGGK